LSYVNSRHVVLSHLPSVYIKYLHFPSNSTRWGMCSYSNYVHFKWTNWSLVAFGYEVGPTREPVLLFHKKKDVMQN
jgi:hypothetical protein